MAPEPFKISVPQSKIDSLKTKLSLVEFPDELDGAGWDLGAPKADVERLAKKWEQWDWYQAQEKLNAELPQFHTGVDVDGFGTLDIHFVWQQSEVKNAIPLLFCHGWPGSFLEVRHILPLLSQQDGPAFHIVAPSLPNFGFSEGVKKRGFAAIQYAETCHKLMQQLNYKEYVTQGGDWGFTITRTMGILYPEYVKASHINMFLVSAAPQFKKHPILALQHAVTPYGEKERAGFARRTWFQKRTLSYALKDSPVALLAWIYEKLHDWTDDYPWTDDQILEWISIYQFSRAGPGAAHNIYYEVTHSEDLKLGHVTSEMRLSYVPKVKLGLAYNPKELAVVPKTWARTLGNVVFEADNERGGHFYATEHPEYLARDLKTMFGKGGGAFGAVKGKSGYDDDRARL